MVLHLGDVRVRAEMQSETDQSSRQARTVKAGKKPGDKGPLLLDPMTCELHLMKHDSHSLLIPDMYSNPPTLAFVSV